MRKLASIQKVTNVRPIEGRDRIEQININGWNVIVKKDEFKEGDLCVYVEIDSKLPEKPEFEFLASKKYIIKTMKLGGVRSEGIVFPLSILPKKVAKKAVVDLDVTKVLGITQYNKEVEEDETILRKISKKLMRFKWYRNVHYKLFGKQKKSRSGKVHNFPYWISKTDETRIQNATKHLTESLDWVASEKLDGSSATYGLMQHGKNFEYVVCSRNRIISEDSSEVWNYISKKHDMRKVLEQLFVKYNCKTSLVIQGEIISGSIQGNKYKLKEPFFYAFNLVVDGISKKFEDGEFKEFGIDNVPVWFNGLKIQGLTVDDVLELATFQSAINEKTLAEGLVFRTFDQNGNVLHSFKAVSPSFLIKNGE